jgi:2,5-diketo-D-gluconate reductase A
VVLAWHLAHGIIVIPKSGNTQRLTSNLRAGDLTLTEQDVQAIDQLART